MAAPPTRGPLTPEQIVDAALKLTREEGVDGWSVRTLAARLETWPNTLYHHVGDRDAIVAQVMDRVVSRIAVPDDDVIWQEWFRDLLGDARRVLGQHPGVAWRLIRDGPAVPSALRVIDRGVARLLDAGFGDRAAGAYGVLLNCGLMHSALADARRAVRQEVGDVTRAMLTAPAPPEGLGDGWRAMVDFMSAFNVSPAAAAAASEQNYVLTVEAVIAGLERILAEG